MAGEKSGGSQLGKNLKAEIDAELIEAYHGTTSLPLQPGTYKKIAVKIVDNQSIKKA
jgi:adenine-specific DNA-methyltransferase